MYFKHPELLFTLFLLLIPVLIHLFQLRRFQRIQFTNVKFLKTIKLETRKSSQLKKWLTLLTRLLLLAAVIFAFAQPFIPSTNNFQESQETVIYLDNSFSMEAPGQNGSLFNEVIQDLIASMPEEKPLSLFTNNKTFRNTTVKAIKNQLIQLPYTSEQLSYEAAYLKGKELFSNDLDTNKQLLLVSDFQVNNTSIKFDYDSTINLKLVQPKSVLTNNISIDSVFISRTTAETLDLSVVLRNYNKPVDNLSVSLFNNDKLLAKSAVNIDKEIETVFTIPANTQINGKLTIEDQGLGYDNSFYFNINDRPKINVLVINENVSDLFLQRIFTKDEFELTSSNLNTLNFNAIQNQNLIVLNELQSISSALKTALLSFKNDGGSVLIIPSGNINLKSYNQLFSSLNIPIYKDSNPTQKRITDINYNHPLLVNAFYAKVTNFQYPKVEGSFEFETSNGSVLNYEDGTSFLLGNALTYVFSSPLNEDITNFKSSQLIVPVLYNIGLQSLNIPQLFYTIGQPNTISIKTILGQDDIISMASDSETVIPQQKTFSNSVLIETGDFPKFAGTIKLKSKNKNLQNISFNYSRKESQLSYHNLTALKDVEIFNKLTIGLDTIKSTTNVNALWKWFVIFALVLLIIEMLLLKYLK